MQDDHLARFTATNDTAVWLNVKSDEIKESKKY